MNILVDLIILVIAVLTIVMAAKRGFIKTVVSAASSLIALIMVACFTGLLAGALVSTPLGDAVYGGVENFVEGLTEKTSITELAQDSDSALYSAMDTLGVDTEDFSEWVEDHLAEEEDKLQKKIVNYIADPVTSLVMRALSTLILFFGTVLLLKLFGKLLTGIVEKIPVIRTFNTLLGLLLGVLLAFVRVLIFCAVVSVIATVATAIGWDFFASLDPEETILFRLFDAIQILKFLF